MIESSQLALAKRVSLGQVSYLGESLYFYLIQIHHMSFVKIWVHLVFATKDRRPLITKDIRKNLCDHIRENCKAKDIYLKTINGHVDHLHCLISLGKDQSISKVSQLIKGESSFWVNKNGITRQKFEWQDDYFGVSVSESQVQTVIDYINNQEAHHAKKSFNQEVREFMEKYGWSIIKEN